VNNDRRVQRFALRHEFSPDAYLSARQLRIASHLALRRAGWTRLTRELRRAPPAELWRYTADVLYLLENPVVREACFPSGSQRYAIEPARLADEAGIMATVERHDGPAAASAMAAWWQHGSDGFSVVRERDGAIAGCYVLLEAARFSKPPFDDPVLARWMEHLAADPVASGERVLFLRRWLSRVEGEAPCAVQAACWLDIKRSYMAYRPHLRRVYLTVRDVESYAAAAAQLGFMVLDACEATIDHQRYCTAMVDFGAGSVDGWLAKLVAFELGIATSSLLDVGARELTVGSRRVPLTPREFDTLHVLVEHTGNVVPREALLTNVWGDDTDVESNVVDVVVRSLRKKLADRANAIETISGIGYRFREGEPAKR
jgi:Transcriptional regulatory protein, C terminal